MLVKLDFPPAFVSFVTLWVIFGSTQCTSLQQCNFLSALLLLTTEQLRASSGPISVQHHL